MKGRRKLQTSEKQKTKCQGKDENQRKHEACEAWRMLCKGGVHNSPNSHPVMLSNQAGYNGLHMRETRLHAHTHTHTNSGRETY